MPLFSSLSNRYGLPVSLLSSSSSSSSKRFPLSAAPTAAAIHFLVVFQTQPQPQVHRSGSKFKVRFMSAQYVKLGFANYERAICQESEAGQAMMCYAMPDVLCYSALLTIFPARSSCLIIICCYFLPDFPALHS